MSIVDSASTTPEEPAATAPPKAPRDRPANRRQVTLDTARPAATDAQRIGEICPTCFTTKSLTGTCDTCE